MPEPVGEELEYRFGVAPTPSGTWLRFFYSSVELNTPSAVPTVFTFRDDTVAFRCKEADGRVLLSELQQHIARTNEVYTEWEARLAAERGES
jgi:hypothetical protein